MNHDLKTEYKRQHQELTKIINEWDPYGLLDGGAPSDEFAHEVSKILTELKKATSVDEVAQIVANVFTENFGEEFLIKDCENVSKEIFVWYQNVGK